MNKLVEEYNLILSGKWDIQHLSDLSLNPIQSIVASSFAGKIKFKYLSILLDRPLLETMLLEDSLIKDSL